MTQMALLVLLLKIALISGFVSLAGWVVLYSILAPWYRDPIGRTLVAKTLLVAGTFLVIVLPTFFSWFTKHVLVTGWIDFTLIGLVSPVMWWRCLVWWRLHRAGRLPQEGDDRLRVMLPGGGAVGGFLYHWVWLDFYSPVWPNIIASVLCAAWVTLKLRAHRKVQEGLRELHERHHAAHMNALALDTPGGLAAVMDIARDAKTAAESAHEAVQTLAKVTAPTPMRRTASDRSAPKDHGEGKGR